LDFRFDTNPKSAIENLKWGSEYGEGGEFPCCPATVRATKAARTSHCSEEFEFWIADFGFNLKSEI
jgi:hypothetical protein